MHPRPPVRHRLLEVLGEGGFAIVYRAERVAADGSVQPVALKVPREPEGPGVFERLSHEARLSRLLDDPAFVRVHGPVRHGGAWALELELIEGRTCRALLERGPFPARVALETVGEVARALAAVHGAVRHEGAIHRDLKPGNLQITPTGRVRILDLGMARALSEPTPDHLGGTPGFIAPERAYGEEGPPADIFGLGVVLGALVAGRRRTAANREKLDAWAASDPDLRQIWALVLETTAWEPADRPGAAELSARCRDLVQRLPGPDLPDWVAGLP